MLPNLNDNGTPTVVASVWQAYSLPPILVAQALGSAGGFSGASFWKVETEAGNYCVRRWPTGHPSMDQLNWMHRVLSHAAIQDCPFVPVPLLNRKDLPATIVDGHKFEIAPWMPGVADYSDDPSDERLKNAVGAIAKFHLGAAQISLDFRPSPNIASRVESLEKSAPSIQRIESIQIESDRNDARELQQILVRRGAETADRLRHLLQPATRMILPVQPVLRDVWHDHILFSQSEVTGLVDFGAMQMDHIVLDLARLLGSLAGDDETAWDLALDSYSEFRKLEKQERELVRVLDQITTLLGSLNWLTWLYIDRRQFESMAHVDKRIRHLLHRLRAIDV